MAFLLDNLRAIAVVFIILMPFFVIGSLCELIPHEEYDPWADVCHNGFVYVTYTARGGKSISLKLDTQGKPISCSQKGESR